MSDRGFDPAERLAEWEARDLRRDRSPAESVGARARFAPDPGSGAGESPGTAPIDYGDEALVFASNDYLGLAGDDRLARAAAVAARSVGTGAGASRLVTGDTGLHRALERDLAALEGTERALVFSSGYAANVGTITALDPDVVFSDARNHASIVDGCRLSNAEVVVYDHRDPADLRRRMRERAGTDGTASGPTTASSPSDGSTAPSWLVVTDSVFSMDGTVAPLQTLCDTADDFGAWVAVDEAHATGVLGPDGRGAVADAGVGDRVDVRIGTLSKALGSQGGFVAGSNDLIEYLANAARSFVFSTGLAPPTAGSAREGLRIARSSDRRAVVRHHAERLREGLEALGFDVPGATQIVPVVVGDRGDALELARGLRHRGVVAPAIRPPTVPEGTARIRIAPSAAHTASEVERCLEAFREAAAEAELP